MNLTRVACVLLSLIGLAACSPKAAVHPDDAALRTFLSRYFDTWSKRDMEGYGDCFDPSARIIYVAGKEGLVSQGTMDFLHGQKLAHEQSPVPMTERPLDMRIQGDEKVVQAAVTWVLSKGSKEERGTDFFTLRRDGAGWKIVSLVFYGE